MEVKMRIEQVIKEYTPFLLKTAYLITRDRAKVEAIVEQTFIKFKVGNSEFVKPSITKSKLLEFLVKSLNEYYKSWHYQKLIVKRIFDNGEQYIHPSFHDDLSYAILRLPLKLRETATFYFYAERTTTEISRLLGVPQGTVQQRLLKVKQLINKPIFEEEVGQQTALIDAYLTEWDERAEFVEQKFIDTVEMIEVAPSNKKRKKIIVGIAVIGAAVLAIVISEFITKKDAQSIEDEQQIGDLKQTYVQDTFEIFPGAIQKSDVLIPPDISLEIAKYFSYYLGTDLHSLSRSDGVGRDEIYTYYSTYYMLEKNNYPFDFERIKFFQELAATSHRSKKGNPNYHSFIQILNEQHNITEQEIIDYYFVPKELGVYFQQEFMKTYIDQFDTYGFLEEYSKIIGYDSEKLYQDYVKEQEAIESKYEELTDLSRLPIDTKRVNAKFALDDEGQIIMLDPYIHFYSYSDEQYFIKFTYENEFSRELNRLSLQDYILFLEEKYNENKNEEFLREYIEGFKIVKRSIDLELD
jgi:RNA polymerase sigma-70 factor, ECF subfamily